MLSIIIPALNEEKYLPLLLLSLAKQQGEEDKSSSFPSELPKEAKGKKKTKSSSPFAIAREQNGQKAKECLAIITENGFGKRTDIKEYKAQGRGGSGIKTANINPKTGNIIAAKILTGEEEDLIVISQKGQVIRTKISQIPKLSRSAQGVRLMRLEQGDKVASATCI